MLFSCFVQDISIAIPDSCLADDKTQKDKSRKIAQIARASAIFGVRAVLVYDDGGRPADRRLLLTILRYMDTPPYMRRLLFPRMEPLKYAGILHPLKIASHTVPPKPKDIRAGDIRDGATVRKKDGRFLEIGAGEPRPYYGREESGRRVSIRFASGYPNLEYREIARDSIPHYWGYQTKQRGKLSSVLADWGGAILLTSRSAKANRAVLKKIKEDKLPMLMVFGSTDRSIREILGGKMLLRENMRAINTIPGQHTETIRVEEAILGSLAVLNSA